MRLIRNLAVPTMCALALLSSVAKPSYAAGLSAAEQKAVTITNLQEAFNGESNAHARYVAFAAQADKDGYPSVASLFRAAALAEQTHASNHKQVIAALGAVPTAKVVAPAVKTTAENLTAAVGGETYERDTMYPTFIKQAREAGNADAVKTFNLALSAEGEHAALYADASGRLASLKGAAKTTYYVCTVCGSTVPRMITGAKCPVCFSPKEKYVAVS